MQRKREWLTEEIVREYQIKAERLGQNDRQDIGEMRKLRVELMQQCGVTEMQISAQRCAVFASNGLNILLERCKHFASLVRSK